MRKTHYFLLLLITSLNLGCATQAAAANRPAVTWTKSASTAEEDSAAKAAAINNLIDPESVRFGEIWALDGTNGERTICGYVNAKNSFGGYTGMKVFTLLEDMVLVEDSGPLGHMVPMICTPRTVN